MRNITGYTKGYMTK